MIIKYLIGLLLIFGGIILGLYVGGWVMFVGGIMAIAKAFDAHTLTASLVAINLIKIVGASFIGWLIVVVTMPIGIAFLE